MIQRIKDIAEVLGENSVMQVWRADLGLQAASHPPTRSLIPLLSRGEDKMKEGQDKKQENPLPITVTSKIDLIWGKII